jgi:hypothetical protein
MQKQRADLAARVMTQIKPVHVELDIVIQVYEFVCHGMFHMLFAREIALAENYCPRLVVKAPRALKITRQARKVFWSNVYTLLL